MTRVNVDVIAYTDPRFVQLAKLLGFADHDHARSKVEYLWLECTLRGTTELPVWVVEAKLGDGSAEALVECELARYTSGRGDSRTRLMYIAGAQDRCLWLVEKKGQSSKGGKARASGASRAGGKFTSRTPAIAGETPPAITSALTLAPALALAPEREQEPLPAGPEPHPSKPPGDPVTRRSEHGAGGLQNIRAARIRIANLAWQVATAEHVRIKLALNSPARGWPAEPGINFQPFEELLERIAELTPGEAPDFAAAEERIRNRIAVAAAEAETKRSLDFFTPHWLWKREQFARADGETPAQVRRRGAGQAEATPLKFTFGAED